jgi:hypothetical protein
MLDLFNSHDFLWAIVVIFLGFELYSKILDIRSFNDNSEKFFKDVEKAFSDDAIGLEDAALIITGKTLELADGFDRQINLGWIMDTTKDLTNKLRDRIMQHKQNSVQ